MKMVRRILLVLAASLLLFSCSGLRNTPAPPQAQIAPLPAETLTPSDVETIGDMAVDLYLLQRSYDSLMSVNQTLAAELVVGEAIGESAIEEATAVKQELAPVVTKVKPELLVEEQAQVTPVVVKKAPVLQEDPEPYMLVFGSFSTFQNASAAIREFGKQYPVLKDRVSMVPTGEKYRVGFVDFASRESALIYKGILIKEFPEFSTTWPCKLDR